MTEKNLYTVAEYAEIAEINQQSVTRIYGAERLGAQMVGKMYRIPRSEIEKLLMTDGKTSAMKSFETTRELEIENKALRTQLELLKNILSSVSNVLNSDM